MHHIIVCTIYISRCMYVCIYVHTHVRLLPFFISSPHLLGGHVCVCDMQGPEDGGYDGECLAEADLELVQLRAREQEQPDHADSDRQPRATHTSTFTGLGSYRHVHA